MNLNLHPVRPHFHGGSGVNPRNEYSMLVSIARGNVFRVIASRVRDNDLIKSSLGGQRYRNIGIETWMHFHDKHFARKRSPINSPSLSKSWENLKVKRSVYIYKMKEQKGGKKGIGEGWLEAVPSALAFSLFFLFPLFSTLALHINASRNLVYDTDTSCRVNDPLSCHDVWYTNDRKKSRYQRNRSL